MALLIVVVSVLPFFSPHLDTLMLYILDFINPTHSSALSKSIAGFLINIDKLGSIGIFYLMFVFTMFFKDYEYVINKIYKTRPRAIYKLFFLYLGFLIFIPILFFSFIFVSSFPMVSFASHFFSFMFIWFLFIILFLLSANTKVSFYAAAFATLATLVVLSITKSLFGYYVASNTTYTTIYGSFSVALFFFLWIYISWSIYLYGIKLCALLNQYIIKNGEKNEN